MNLKKKNLSPGAKRTSGPMLKICCQKSLLYQSCSNIFDLSKNMAAMGESDFHVDI